MVGPDPGPREPQGRRTRSWGDLGARETSESRRPPAAGGLGKPGASGRGSPRSAGAFGAQCSGRGDLGKPEANRTRVRRAAGTLSAERVAGEELARPRPPARPRPRPRPVTPGTTAADAAPTSGSSVTGARKRSPSRARPHVGAPWAPEMGSSGRRGSPARLGAPCCLPPSRGRAETFQP